ncbi:HNH endonuclease [Falsiroseomonas sp. HC035]|uniref:HNH endonuclease n=1 Tax=Falsiroseomonas sp. HC035 TaxID=3390999 RepID=UPI003D3235AC
MISGFTECIFCKKNAENLTDEHIIPYAMNGTAVLRRATCESCARITGRFEHELFREYWLSNRVNLGMKSRKKKTQPKTVRLPLQSDKARLVEIPVDEVPLPTLMLPNWPAPGILRGLPSTTEYQMTLDHQFYYDIAAMAKLQNTRGVSNRHRFRDQTFARVIAKIAYTDCISKYGIQHYTPFLSDFILSQQVRHDYKHYIGGTDLSRERLFPEPSPQHMFSCAITTIPEMHEDCVYAVSYLNFFSGYGTPVYAVVSGKFDGIPLISGATPNARK